MDLRKLRLTRNSIHIIDSYSSLDIPIVRKASYYSLMLIGGTATQLLARAYGVKERRKRSINDLDFLTSAKNQGGVKAFERVIQEHGFTPASKDNFEYMLNYENKEVGCDVDVLISWEPDIMDRAIRVNGILVQDPCWQFVQKLQRITTGFGSKRTTDTQDLNTLFDVVEKRGEIDKLQRLISEEVPDIEEEFLNSLLQE